MTRSAGTSGLTRRGSPPSVGHRVAHDGQVDDGRHAGEVLEDHPGRHERDLGLAAVARRHAGERRHVLLPDDPAAGVAEDVLEQDLERERGPAEVGRGHDAAAIEGLEGEPVGQARDRATPGLRTDR